MSLINETHNFQLILLFICSVMFLKSLSNVLKYGCPRDMKLLRHIQVVHSVRSFSLSYVLPAYLMLGITNLQFLHFFVFYSECLVACCSYRFEDGSYFSFNATLWYIVPPSELFSKVVVVVNSSSSSSRVLMNFSTWDGFKENTALLLRVA